MPQPKDMVEFRELLLEKKPGESISLPESIQKELKAKKARILSVDYTLINEKEDIVVVSIGGK